MPVFLDIKKMYLHKSLFNYIVLLSASEEDLKDPCNDFIKEINTKPSSSKASKTKRAESPVRSVILFPAIGAM